MVISSKAQHDRYNEPLSKKSGKLFALLLMDLELAGSKFNNFEKFSLIFILNVAAIKALNQFH